MALFSVFLAALSCVLVLFDFGPGWAQKLVLAVASAFFLLTFLQARHAKKKAGAWLLPVVLLLVLVNFTARYVEHVFDLSQSKMYQLRPQTIEWLEGLKQPITILVFLRSDDKTAVYAEFLRKKFAEKTALVDLQIKNINRDVELTRKYQINTPGQAVLISGGNWVTIANFQEKTLVPGLVRLLAKAEATLCFVSGHGEADLADDSASGLTLAQDALQNIGFSTRTIALADFSAESLQEACGVLFFVGAKTAFLETEIELLEEALFNGVAALFAVDPLTPGTFKGLLQKFGLTLTGQLVVEPGNAALHLPITHITMNRMGEHPALAGLQGRVLLPEVQNLQVKESSLFQWAPLFQTLEADPYRLVDSSESGSFLLAAGAVNTRTQKPQAIVFGSSKTFMNQFFDFSSNQQLLLSNIQWLTGAESFSWLESSEDAEKELSLSQRERTILKYFFVVALPLFAFLGCGFMLLRRRK